MDCGSYAVRLAPHIDLTVQNKLALIGFRGGEASTGKQGWEALVREQKRV